MKRVDDLGPSCVQKVVYSIGSQVPTAGVMSEPRLVTPDDTELLRAIYLEHWTPLVRLAWMLTGDRDGAEDVVQEVFRRAAPRLASVVDPGPFLRTAIRNAVRDTGRRHRSPPPSICRDPR